MLKLPCVAAFKTERVPLKPLLTRLIPQGLTPHLDNNPILYYGHLGKAPTSKRINTISKIVVIDIGGSLLE